MLITEKRLRELYAAGEIDLDELNRSMDLILRREEMLPAARASCAAAPMTPEEREAVAARIASSKGPKRRAARRCPVCRSELREVTENGVNTAWCSGCHAYRGPDPRAAPVADEHSAGSAWFVGGIFPIG